MFTVHLQLDVAPQNVTTNRAPKPGPLDGQPATRLTNDTNRERIVAHSWSPLEHITPAH